MTAVDGGGAAAASTGMVDCGTSPCEGLERLFVDVAQRYHIDHGEKPALRAVFRKTHGGAHGVLRIRSDVPEGLRVGLFALGEVPAWVRFSSDIAPGDADFASTLGVGVKLFGVPGAKLVGAPDDATMDLLLQDHDVFFAATATEMCEATSAGLSKDEKEFPDYLNAHPWAKAIMADMKSPVSSALGAAYWSVVPFRLGERHVVKYKLAPVFEEPPPTQAPNDPDYLTKDLARRLGAGDVLFELQVQLRTDPERMPVDDATVRWEEVSSPPVTVADLLLPCQDVNASGQAEFVENLSFNIWRAPVEHAPLGSLAEARRAAYAASADQRRALNGVALSEPASPELS